jgi:hypothetical protein
VGTRSLCTSLGGFPRLKGPELGTRKVGDTTDVSTGFARISESKIKVIFDLRLCKLIISSKHN